jgi:hypothetical protein
LGRNIGKKHETHEDLRIEKPPNTQKYKKKDAKHKKTTNER